MVYNSEHTHTYSCGHVLIHNKQLCLVPESVKSECWTCSDRMHPWKNHLRSLVKMLEGDISLPHIFGNTHGFMESGLFNQSWIISTDPLLFTICETCDNGFRLRENYRTNKETMIKTA
jgi:hypothetical protein